MSARTRIEWCDSTFNPWTGCQAVSPGCDRCYAEAWSKRSGIVQWGPHAERRRTTPANWRKPLQWNDQEFVQCVACGWRGAHDQFRRQDVGFASSCCPACAGDAYVPARRRVFCASLADVFDPKVPAEWRRDLFELIARTPALDWLLLTKRIGNAHRMIELTMDALDRLQERGTTSVVRGPWPWPNVWLGATLVTQAEADRDIPKLLATPATVRFLSVEPMLGPVDLTRIDTGDGDFEIYPLKGTTDCYDHDGPIPDIPSIDWVIAGGESGPGARPMHPEWARSLRDQCEAAGVQFLFKQWGGWRPLSPGTLVAPEPCFHAFPDGQAMVKVGKKWAGRVLDGRTHDGFPEVAWAS